MATLNLNTLLTGQTSGGVWSNGACGTNNQTTPFTITGSTVTIPDGTAAGTYNFNYSFTAMTGCSAVCTTVMVTVALLPKAGTGTSTTLMQGDTNLFDLFSLLTGEESGGTWSTTSGVNVSNGSAIDVSGLSAGTYTFTYSVSNSCGTDSENVTINITGTCPSAGTFNTGANNQVCIV